MDKNYYENDEIRYRFTKYLNMAVIRTRNHYIDKEVKRTEWEQLTETTYQFADIINRTEDSFYKLSQKDFCLTDVNVIRTLWDQYADGTLRTEVLKLKDQELLILFIKVYGEMNFAQIGEILHMPADKVSNIYSYVRKKLKKGCGQTNGI